MRVSLYDKIGSHDYTCKTKREALFRERGKRLPLRAGSEQSHAGGQLTTRDLPGDTLTPNGRGGGRTDTEPGTERNYLENMFLIESHMLPTVLLILERLTAVEEKRRWGRNTKWRGEKDKNEENNEIKSKIKADYEQGRC